MDAHPYELFLDLQSLEHRRTLFGSPQTIVFVERFFRTAREEFFAVALKRPVYTTIDALQQEFEA